MLNEKQVGTVDWLQKDSVTKIEGADEESMLDIMVENCGRVNYGDFQSPVLNSQRKGKLEIYHFATILSLQSMKVYLCLELQYK